MVRVTLREQIAALEILLANRKGFVETLRELVKNRKREPVELEIAERPIMGLEAAIRTLKWVEANETTIKEAVRRQGTV